MPYYFFNEDGTFEEYQPPDTKNSYLETAKPLPTSQHFSYVKSPTLQSLSSAKPSKQPVSRLPTKPKTIVFCPICRNGVSLKRLGRHLQRVHQVTKKCPLCSVMVHEGDLIDHLLALHRENIYFASRVVKISTGGQPLAKQTPDKHKPQAAVSSSSSKEVSKQEMVIQRLKLARNMKKQPDLSRMDLQGVSLYNLGLDGVNLAEADLRGADLSRSRLRRSNLRGANLQKAKLQQTNLTQADLTGADLRGADLRGAQLAGANLHEANLTGARLPQQQQGRSRSPSPKVPKPRKPLKLHKVKSKKSTSKKYDQNPSIESLDQSYHESRDGSKGLGHMRRDFNGTYGSYPLHDDYGDEGSAD